MESKTLFLSTPTSICSPSTIDKDYVRVLSSERLFKCPGKGFHWPDFTSPIWYPPGKGGKRKKVKSKRRKAVLKAHRK